MGYSSRCQTSWMLWLLPKRSPHLQACPVPTILHPAPRRTFLKLTLPVSLAPRVQAPVVLLFPLNPVQTLQPRNLSPQLGQEHASAAAFLRTPSGLLPSALAPLHSQPSQPRVLQLYHSFRAISFLQPQRGLCHL